MSALAHDDLVGVGNGVVQFPVVFPFLEEGWIGLLVVPVIYTLNEDFGGFIKRRVFRMKS